jgi:hypothetical protein
MAAPTYVSQNNGEGFVRLATGEFTTDATDTATITLGFKARFVRVVDETTQEDYTWISTMGATDILQRVDAGTAAMDTTQILTAGDRSFTFVPKANKTYSWAAFG